MPCYHLVKEPKAGKRNLLLRSRTNLSSTAVEVGWEMAHYAIGMADKPVDGYVEKLEHVLFDAMIEGFMSEKYIPSK